MTENDAVVFFIHFRGMEMRCENDSKRHVNKYPCEARVGEHPAAHLTFQEESRQGHLNRSHKNNLTQDDQAALEVDVCDFC